MRKYIKCDIILKDTEDITNGGIFKVNGELTVWVKPNTEGVKYKHVYVIGEREIKEGYVYDNNNCEIIYYNGNYGEPFPKNLKSILGSTDKSLGLPTLSRKWLSECCREQLHEALVKFNVGEIDGVPYEKVNADGNNELIIKPQPNYDGLTITDDSIVTFDLAVMADEYDFRWHTDWRYDLQNDNELINWKAHKVEEFFNSIDGNSGYEYHYSKYLRDDYDDKFLHKDEGFYLAAPTLAQLQKWLMIKHNIFVGPYLVEAFQGGKLIDQPDVEGVEYHYYIWVNGIKIDTYGSCGSYDKVLNDGLYQALQLIKKEKK